MFMPMFVIYMIIISTSISKLGEELHRNHLSSCNNYYIITLVMYVLILCTEYVCDQILGIFVMIFTFSVTSSFTPPRVMFLSCSYILLFSSSKALATWITTHYVSITMHFIHYKWYTNLFLLHWIFFFCFSNSHVQTNQIV